MVRYDEADQIMFDIIKDEYNDFNTGTNVRIPTLKTLPAFIDKIKGKLIQQKNSCGAILITTSLSSYLSYLPISLTLELKTYLVMDEADSLLANNDESIFNSSEMAALLENGGTGIGAGTANEPGTSTDTNDIPNYENGIGDTRPAESTDDNNFNNDTEMVRLRQKQMHYKAQFIKAKMDAYVEKHQRKCYKMDLELYKIEKDLGLPPSDFTKKFFAPQAASEPTPATQQTVATTSDCNELEMSQSNDMQSASTPLPQISLVNGVHCSMNNSAFLPDINIKREINFDEGSHFDFM